MSSNTNFAVWNALTKGSYSGLTNGNTTLSSISAADLAGCTATMGITTGKWYWEIYIHFNGTGFIYAGLSSGYEGGGFYSGASTTNGMTPGAIRIRDNGTLSDSSSSDDPDRWGTITLTSTNVTSFTDGDILGFALDYDNKKLWISKNGTFYNSGNPAAGSNQQASWDGDVPIIYPAFEPYYPGTPNNGGTANFGQDSSFSGNKTSGSAAATDGNGYGDFYYTPPTDYLALCSANLPTSDDIDPAQTDSDYPGKNFNVVTYTGNGSTQSITGLGFQPDMVWINERSSSQDPSIYDSSRGVTKRLKSSTGEAESTVAAGFTAFGSDGFSLGSATENNDSGETFVAWSWRANGGTTSSNSSGDITSTVQANQAAGFSIITYTGTGSNATIGHGLSAAPDFFMTKDRGRNENWAVYHSSRGATKYLTLNDSVTEYANSNRWNDTEPTDTLFSLGTNDNVNGSSATYVAYAWHNVDGYSRFGGYTGNGNADGPFVYTGFRPRMLFIKQVDNTSNWNVFDTARDTKNYVSRHVVFDSGVQEYEGSSYSLDILSNGFKIRASWGQINTNGSDYVYGAWGDVPTKFNNTF